MQHFTIKAILLPLLLLLGTVCATAQVRAITSDGDEVILYPNGTWEYLSSRPAPNPHPGASATIGAGASGKRVGILLNRQLLFVLREGQLEDLFIYNTRGQLVYSYREGIYQIPYGWRVEYEPLSDRVRQFGPYQFRYQLLSERLEQVGTCKIDYELLSERVRRIETTASDTTSSPTSSPRSATLGSSTTPSQSASGGSAARRQVSRSNSYVMAVAVHNPFCKTT